MRLTCGVEELISNDHNRGRTKNSLVNAAYGFLNNKLNDMFIWRVLRLRIEWRDELLSTNLNVPKKIFVSKPEFPYIYA